MARGEGGAGGAGGVTGSGGIMSASGGAGGGLGGITGSGGTTHAFTGSPCVTTDFSSEFVFGHGNDGAIYQRAYLNSAWQPWVKVAIDASKVDPASALDCAGNSNTINLIATSTAPHQILRTSGSGIQFSSFSSLLGSQAFDPAAASIAVRGSGDSFYMFGAINFGAVVWTVDSGTFAPLDQISGQTNAFSSAIHVAIQQNNPAESRLVVGYETSGQLAIYGDIYYQGTGTWHTPVYLAPPSGAVFAYAPTICVDTEATGKYTVHLAAVTTDGRVWDAYTNSLWATAFSTWEHVGDAAASAVDCTMMTDGTVRIVALDANGQVMDFHGMPANWQKSDLGTF
jgi:hypothetical protein